MRYVSTVSVNAWCISLTLLPSSPSSLRPFLGFASLFTTSLSVSVHDLAKSMALAGELGTVGLRNEDKETADWDGVSFTVVNNAHAKRVCGRVYL